jgi:hypothetical protein
MDEKAHVDEIFLKIKNKIELINLKKKKVWHIVSLDWF